MANGSIVLTSGREQRLQSLAQHSVYAGLLEGLPTREHNRDIVAHAVKAARATASAVYLVPPDEQVIPCRGKYPFGEPARLPDIVCTGAFASREDDPLTGSALSIVWFQDDFAFPIAPAVLAHIQALDWPSLSHVFEY